MAKGADVNSKLDDGTTLLHWAVLKAHREVVEFLVENGADVNVENNEGKTPLPVTLEKLRMNANDPRREGILRKDYSKLIEFLRKHGAMD